jgi:hypothetical protein
MAFVGDITDYIDRRKLVFYSELAPHGADVLLLVNTFSVVLAVVGPRPLLDLSSRMPMRQGRPEGSRRGPTAPPSYIDSEHRPGRRLFVVLPVLSDQRADCLARLGRVVDHAGLPV